MAESNVKDDEPVTSEEEQDAKSTETSPEGETSPDKGNEPPAGAKSWESALQQARLREKEKEAKLTQKEAELQEIRQKMDELEMRDMAEADKFRIKSERAEQRIAELEQERQVEEIKKTYRTFLADTEGKHPKTVAFLRKQMDKDVYPVTGQSPEEFERNFEDFATDYEGTTSEAPRSTASNPAYESPEEVDTKNLSATELRKVLPIHSRD